MYVLPIANRLGVVHKVVIETQIKETTMSHKYNRREMPSVHNDRQAILDMVEQIFTIVAIGFSLVVVSGLALVVAYMVGTSL